MDNLRIFGIRRFTISEPQDSLKSRWGAELSAERTFIRHTLSASQQAAVGPLLQHASGGQVGRSSSMYKQTTETR